MEDSGVFMTPPSVESTLDTQTSTTTPHLPAVNPTPRSIDSETQKVTSTPHLPTGKPIVTRKSDQADLSFRYLMILLLDSVILK